MTVYVCVCYRAVRMVDLPKTLEDLYHFRSRREGHICEVRGPPNHRSLHGFIEVPAIAERLFFQENLSGIQKREIGNCYVGAKVSFSVDKRDKGFFAKDLYITCKVRMLYLKCLFLLVWLFLALTDIVKTVLG